MNRLSRDQPLRPRCAMWRQCSHFQYALHCTIGVAVDVVSSALIPFSECAFVRSDVVGQFCSCYVFVSRSFMLLPSNLRVQRHP